MAFNLQARTVIESATLDLTAAQLRELAEAAPHLEQLIDSDVPGSIFLEPAWKLLASISSLVAQTGTIKPKRQLKRRKDANPTSGGPA